MIAVAEGRSVSSPVHESGAFERTASAPAAVILPKAFEDSPSTPFLSTEYLPPNAVIMARNGPL